MASTTKAGWSNRIYSELLSVNNCLAFNENSSHLACWRATSASYFCCSGSGGRDGSSEWTPCLPVESTRMGREPSERLCCSRCHPPAFAPPIGRVLRYRQQELRSPRSVGLQPLHRPRASGGCQIRPTPISARDGCGSARGRCSFRPSGGSPSQHEGNRCGPCTCRPLFRSRHSCNNNPGNAASHGGTLVRSRDAINWSGAASSARAPGMRE